jgi:hypothetical protein
MISIGGTHMSYFVKKTTRRKGTYFQIYDSAWDAKERKVVSRCHESFGTEDDIKEKYKTDDPLAFLRKRCDELNQRNKLAKAEKLSQSASVFNAGYFLLSSMADTLGVRPFIDSLADETRIKYSLSDLLLSLAYARVVKPCSKIETANTVLPSMYDGSVFTRDQIYDGLELIGERYEDIIEAANFCLPGVHKPVMDHAFFDCTNFYFEIDLEDDFRRKGPSKENRPLPLVGMGLLLDGDLIPVGMRVYPGNESEKRYLPEIVDTACRQLSTGRTRVIEVADKGLNCEENIVRALASKNGYLFSKSIKTMFPYKENDKKKSKDVPYEMTLDWIYDESGYQSVRDKDGNELYRYKSIISEYEYTHRDDSGKAKKIRLKEKRLVTYNPSLAKKQRIEMDKLKDKIKHQILSKAKRDEYGEGSRFVSFTTIDQDGVADEGRVLVTFDEDRFAYNERMCGYNMLVTSETDMSSQKMYDTYHRLTNIERTFRVMKSQLEARPIYVSKEASIKGHFLTIYYAILLLRLLEVEYLKKDSTMDPELLKNLNIENLISFISGLNYTEVTSGKYKCLATASKVGELIEKKTGLPVTNRFVTEKDLQKTVNFKIKKKDLGTK